MSYARAWRAFVFCGCVGGACAVPRAARAAPTASADEANAPARIEVALLGDAAQDSLLFERIRSLFSAQTTVLPSDEHQLDQRAVLSPRRVDTVYIWIRVSEGSAARVYLTLAEQGEQVRYLFREIQLESGLDEVGSETLAEVAHSSARALWLREQQSSREALVNALERETPAQPEPATAADPSPSPVVVRPPSAPNRDSAESAPRSSAERRSPAALRLGIGASGTTHSSGAEGWMQEVGGFFAAEYRGRLSLRAAVRYLVPTDFGVPPARVHLTGGSGELRAGWLSSDPTRMRVRLEAGLGALLGSAEPSIVDEQPKARALGAHDFHRAYALAAAGLEWPFGPAWVATSLDLRVPLGGTSYEVSGLAGSTTSASLCPGGSLEVGFGFDPDLR